MGKSKNKKGAAVRPSPLGNGAASRITDADFEESLENDDDALQLIHGELTAGSATNKEIGCYKLAMIAEKKHKQILELKMVKMVAPLIIDEKDGVQVSAVGALKNLSLVSEDVCDEMIKQDVMTPLCKLIGRYEKDWQPTAAPEAAVAARGDNKVEAAAIDVTKEVFIESVALLSNLCEASTVAVNTFNENNLIRILLMHLDASKFGHQVVTSVLQCVCSVSENNPPAIQALKEQEAIFSQILATSEIGQNPSDLYVRVLACGVIMNVSREPSVLPPIMNTIASVLGQDQRKKASDFTSLIPLDGVKNGRGAAGDKKTEEDKSKEKAEEVDLQLKTAENSLKDVLLGQQSALEILANLCCDDNDDEDANDADMESDMSDENSSLNGDNDGQDEDGMEVSYAPSVSADITAAIISNNLVQAVLACANLPAENVMDILLSSPAATGGKAIVKLLSALRVRAFLCLSNLISALSMDDLGGPEALFSVWSNLGLLCFTPTEPQDNKKSHKISIKPNEELLESATSAMRAATQKLLEAKCFSLFSGLTQSDLEQMLKFGAASPHATVRINMVQIVGHIGLALTSSSETGSNVVARSMANFLLEAAAKDTDLRVVAEALDKIFDMFAEDDTDQLSVSVSLVVKLKQLVPGFKAKVGMARKSKSGGEFNVIVDMARTNLLRFIKYKEKRPLVAASLKK